MPETTMSDALPARYHLSPLQREALLTPGATLHVLLPMPMGLLGFDADLVEFARTALVDIDPYWVRTAEPLDVPVRTLSRLGDNLTAVLGKIIPEEEATGVWHVVIICVDVSLSVEPRLIDHATLLEWPGAVELNDGFRIPSNGGGL